MEAEPDPYYRHDLALVHRRGLGFHADLCAPDILDLLKPVRDRGGLVLEFPAAAEIPPGFNQDPMPRGCSGVHRLEHGSMNRRPRKDPHGNAP